MNEFESNPSPQDAREPARYTPDGYRSGIITAISVLVGFSLAFMRYWGFEAPGDWKWHYAISTALMVGSVLMQLFALFRSLQVEDHEIPHYRVTIRWFVWGVLLMVIGLLFAAAEMSTSSRSTPLF
ncbi:MAG: hypothetical protein JSS21_08855 [Proteobacteria bacterium]|nr:hypothetical protein [Pseudomonadota bacterium]